MPVIPCLFSQVLAACLYPKLLKTNCLPLDVRQRTQRILGDCEGGSVGENEEHLITCTDFKTFGSE